ncbi:MFS transporter [Meiothermus sp. CFH 77666]|uniref:MFS transporter n=1 Tax=Meiothermus sp. CFH 77666 TaxID=2817942 RepID=UPI001AA02B2C|nr:MFS transporter [Meiothermus sp. CFH 77666]MBO1437989.1 MFS transporter [Meiothermus sp. CFH 77666]
MKTNTQTAWRLVVGLGLVSLFADFTYEGGRSISGPFLAVLGAGPLLVGAVAGVGEFLGYLVRLFAGRWVDRSGQPWRLMYLGYALNLLSIPALALAPSAWGAALLLFLERLGKGLRTPARDALLSHAGDHLGQGKVFGLHELLDQSGAFLGPLLVALLVSLGGYRLGFAGLLVPALLALVFLLSARRLDGVARPSAPQDWESLPRAYYAYLLFAMLTVAGFAHFQLVAYHLEATRAVPAATIPLLFALAMGADALVAYGVGHLFDRLGLRLLWGVPVLSLAVAPLFFLGQGLGVLVLAALLWGSALGLQESLMRTAVAVLSPQARRGSAYGLFDTAFGGAWMLGSLAMGFFYSLAPRHLVAFAVLLQIAAALFLWRFYATLKEVRA